MTQASPNVASPRPPSLLRFVFLDRPFQKSLILLTSLLAAVLGLLSPYFQKGFIDRILGQPSSLMIGSMRESSPLIMISAAFLATLLGQGLTVLSTYLSSREAVIAQRELSERLYRQTLAIRSDRMGRRTVGEIVSLYATDVAGASILLEQTLPSGASIFFPFLLAPAAIIWLYHIPLWATLAIGLFLLTINTAMALRQSRFFFRFKRLAAERTGLVSEWIQNMRALRILGWTPAFEQKIFAKRAEETVNRVSMVTNGQVMNSISTSVTYAINIMAIASVVALRGGTIAPGELLALLWILGIFLARPFRQLPWFFTMGLDGLSSLRRLEDYLAIPAERRDLADPEPAQPLASPHGLGLDIRDLNLTLGGNALLQNISLQIRPGEFLAVVGEVGSGKSLFLLSLMGETAARFDDYQIDGVRASELNPQELRSRFSYSPQEGFVMSATLRENVAFDYAVDSSRDSDITASLERAQFSLKSESVQDGLDTEIGERGVNLSGGQRQRIGLARTDFYDRPILLLDDCLSAVDVDTERGLTSALFFGRWRQKTRILVTHRLTVLAKVDRIAFLQKGRLLALGTFGELQARSGPFRDFTASVAQSEEFERTGDFALAQKGGSLHGPSQPVS